MDTAGDNELVVRTRAATPDDADFVAIAIRDAERCHVGTGLFDALVGDSNFMEHGTEHDTVSFFLKHVCLQRY